MANIQQSINSILSSAQGGAFLLSQTPYYKQQGQIKALKAESKRLGEADKTLTKQMEEVTPETPSSKVIAQYEVSKNLDRDIYENQMALYKTTGKREYLEEAQKFTPAARENWDELIAAERATRSATKAAQASQTAQGSMVTRELTLANTIDTVRANREYLSAKQRGQLETMIHTLDKKGALK